MQPLEVSGAVRLIYRSLGVKGLNALCILLHPIIRLKMWNKGRKLYAAKYSNCSVQYSLK